LPLKQNELSIKGHAIEIRVYAEDSLNNFTPDIGTLDRYRIPSGNGVRVDDAYDEGMEIPIFYDPMIAKLVVYSDSRNEAIKNTLTAIDDYEISGVKTTLDFAKFVLNHDAFISGDFDTNFVKLYFDSPNVLYTSFTKEKEALDASVDLIWNKIIEDDKKDAASIPITSSWKLNN